MVMSVVNIQDAYARALLVDRAALRAASADGDVLAGHQVLLDAYNTDVRSLCAGARRALGAADDPVAALRASGRADRIAAERGEAR
jgi:L-rhamnose isomerase/sugar isomerase